MSKFKTKKSKLEAALNGDDPTLVSEILAWLNEPPPAGVVEPLDDDDGIIIHKKGSQ